MRPVKRVSTSLGNGLLNNLAQQYLNIDLTTSLADSVTICPSVCLSVYPRVSLLYQHRQQHCLHTQKSVIWDNFVHSFRVKRLRTPFVSCLIGIWASNSRNKKKTSNVQQQTPTAAAIVAQKKSCWLPYSLPAPWPSSPSRMRHVACSVASAEDPKEAADEQAPGGGAKTRSRQPVCQSVRQLLTSRPEKIDAPSKSKLKAASISFP